MKRGEKFNSHLSKGRQAVVGLIEVNSLARPENLAQALGISEGAAKKRVRRLIKIGVLSEMFVVNKEFSSLPAQALVFAKIASGRLRRSSQPGYSGIREFVSFMKSGLSKTREWVGYFKSKPGECVRIDEVYSVSGGGMGTDVVMLIAGTSEALLREFIIEVVAEMPGVDETNTAAISYDGL